MDIFRTFIFITILLSWSHATDVCSRCPGLYCGRKMAGNSTNCNLECSACQRGYRSDSFFCRPCNHNLRLYDWLFLGFMSLVVAVLHCYAISMFHSNSKGVWILYGSTVIETTVSFIALILSLEPKGSMRITTCKVHSIKDWYTLFFNPRPDYLTTHRCTQEAVYPLYSAIFINLLFSFVLMLLLRGCLIRILLRNYGRMSFYVGLYIIPVVGALHACLAGVFYYIYPYVVLFLSVVGIAIFLSRITNEDYFKKLRKPKHVAVVICYFVAHAYGIISVTELKQPTRDYPSLLIVFLPICFYTLTRPYTQADRFKTL